MEQKKQPLLPISEGPLCPVTICMRAIGGKWKLLILWVIHNDLVRFGQMMRVMPGITKQMLTKQLRELEADGVLHRKVFAEVPPRVEYSLTKKGQSLMPIVFAMRDWGMRPVLAPHFKGSAPAEC